MDVETVHLALVLKAKQARLRVLDEQAANFGPLYTPPHIEMERGSLRDELAMIETAIQSPARAEVTDELGPAGRFLVNHQQNLDIKKSIASLSNKFDEFATASHEWRKAHRMWLLIIGVFVLLILITVVAIVTYIVTRGGM